MSSTVSNPLDRVHPQMLRAAFVRDPQKVGEADRRRALGQIFEAALDRARLTKQQAAGLMGYSDQAVIGRWVSGTERVQLDKCALLGPEFLQQFAAALVEDLPGVNVRVVIDMSRSA